MDYPVNEQERRSLLAECGQMIRQAEEITKTSTTRTGNSPTVPAGGILRKVADLKTLYRDHLPVLPLSRCPFTGQVLYRSIDTFGIDGYWWDYHNPVRLLTYLPSTFFSFTGALQLCGPVEETSFLCIPGPGVPFVIPELLSNDTMRGVISSLRIGPHTGYPIVYFADPVPQGVERANDWGTDHWKYTDLYGRVHWNESVGFEDEYDFDLVPYLQSKKILWISPDDVTMTLRSGLAGCPFADMKGEQRVQRIQHGEVWTT